MAKLDFWEIVFYAALAVFIAWALLKSFGVIQSPLWLEVGVPALSAGIAIGSFYQKFRQLERDLGHVEKDLGEIKPKIIKLYANCPEMRH